MNPCNAGYISQFSQDLSQGTSTVRQAGADGSDEVSLEQGGSAPVGSSAVAALPQSVRDALADAATYPEYVIRTARKEHTCAGWHDGQRRRRCPLGPIQPGEVHVADVSDPPIGSPFGERKYHAACARTQGMLREPSTPASDAMADAETLRRCCPFWRGDRIVRAEHEVNANLWIAGWQGMRAGTLPPPLETADQAAACARIAGRAAFRAVPALRDGDAALEKVLPSTPAAPPAPAASVSSTPPAIEDADGPARPGDVEEPVR